MEKHVFMPPQISQIPSVHICIRTLFPKRLHNPAYNNFRQIRPVQDTLNQTGLFILGILSLVKIKFRITA